MKCFTVKDRKNLWDYAKETYLKVPGPHGYPDFKELVTNLSDDIFKATGGTIQDGQRVGGTFLTPEEVAQLIAGNKVLRNQRNVLLMAEHYRNSSLKQARDFVAGTTRTPLQKTLSTLYQVPYVGKTLAHGFALHMTHGWPLIFDPATWRLFGKTWWSSLRSMSPDYARTIADKIRTGSRFDEKIKSGLAVNPDHVYDDVQNRADFWGDKLGPYLGKVAGKIAESTSNSFMGLKLMRDGFYDTIYDQVPEHLRTQTMNDAISAYVDHMTGAPWKEGARVIQSKAGKAAKVAMFAPSLDIARIMRPVDFIKALGTEGRRQLNQIPGIGEKLKEAWGQASPEQQWIARYQMKQWARIAGVFSSLLYVNHLALKHMFGRSGKDDVNITNPFSADWMAPKGPDGSILQATGGQVPMIRAAARATISPSQAPDAIGNYLVGKLNPALSIARGAITGKRFGGEGVPGVSEPFTVGNTLEYMVTEFGPIATEAGIQEFSKQMKDQTGVPQEWHAKVLKAIRNAALVTVPSALGTHLYKPLPPKKAEEKLKPAIR